MALIELDNIVKSYGNDGSMVNAVSGFSEKINVGEFLAILGHSGSGKSTVLSILGGLNHPSSGKVFIDDLDIYDLQAEQLADFRKEYIGFVFQDFHLIPYLTVLENVMIPLAISEGNSSEKSNKAMLMLEKVRMADKSARLPGQLSGGEQERVAIARALVNEPPIILADEPTGNLDSATSESIMRLFAKLNNEGQTIIMVTHNRDTVNFVNRAIFMQDGKIHSENVH